MKWLMATVTFRYHMYSPNDLVRIARNCGFQGLELWEPHLNRHQDELIQLAKQTDLHMYVLGAYLDLTNFSSDSYNWKESLQAKFHLSHILKISTLRLFSGNLSYRDSTTTIQTQWLDRIDILNQLAQEAQIDVVFEVHPQTLLDDIRGVELLLKNIDKRNWTHVGLNFDAFHVWELGVDPLVCLQNWYPYVKHVHLKNARKKTDQFRPTNVFHPNGNVHELASLKQGVVEIKPLIEYLGRRSYNRTVTLEWFGNARLQFLKEEVNYLNSCLKSQTIQDII
ncbi:Sugar phosphate isomerase/epimerase [Seinonella peptonophila]|uniref:Sugar phosphate isomerase/epimerase n=1 Tax=Seinonella peptonophila TaxID=112248 RepID=A0A1M5AJR6_9BACL|nr:sugar phosphate isomerase/epimerase family protein [Seinonella peptonophila]SHF30518.1 Sugar phosphate isomerase/epimerase [Seinonella peptonophila]